MRHSKKIIHILIINMFVFSAYSQEIPIQDFNEFEKRLHHTTDSVYFINFWATWCIPCIKEMPAIQELAEKHHNHPLKIILVSLDQPDKIESGLKPFIKKHKLELEIVLLDDPDFNSWIDKVSPTWAGGIPATLIYTKHSRDFYEQSFEFEELDKIINSKLNQL